MSMPISHPWLAPRSPRIARNGGGNTDVGRSVPPPGARGEVAVSARRRQVAMRERVSRMLLKASELRTPRSRGVLCRAWRAPSVRDDSGESSRGVSDPLCHPPNPVPGPVARGSLTPRLRVSFVRTNESAHASSTRHGAGPATGRPLVARSASRRSPPSSHIFLNRRAPCH